MTDDTTANFQNKRLAIVHRTLAVIFVASLVVYAILQVDHRQATAGASLMPIADPTTKISPRVLRDTADGKTAAFIVVMSNQADLSAAYKMTDQNARGWYVYDTLWDHAERDQSGVRALLDANHASYKPFWVANMLVVTGDRTLVNLLAERPDVGKIEANGSLTTDDGRRTMDDSLSSSIVRRPSSTEWGVQNVNAPQVWAMGYTGQGIVVSSQDTGMQWDHPALRPHYRGWDGSGADHNYHWWDAIHTGQGNPCGVNAQAPCDDNGHGTHTTGTASGDDGAGNQIGVAPGAQWIGCRGFDRVVGTAATFTECFQFMIAPTDLAGNNPDPTRRPHVMSNSWLCESTDGCAPDTLRQIVENVQAAGVFVVASASGGGPACSSIQDPPGIYDVAFTAGAHSSSNALANFSGRGPVTSDGSNRLKPNISAPGINVRSSWLGGGYSFLSGTSASSPHVAGVVALLWSARPELARQITETKTILQNSANPAVSVSASQPYCGGTPPTQIPNNYFGYGRVDALAAVNSVQQLTPTSTSTATPTFAMTASPTTTPIWTATISPTSVPPTISPTPTLCAVYYEDVRPSDYFYEAVLRLACQGVFSCCGNSFRPYNNTTRGQLCKIVVLGFEMPINTNGGPHFTDVPSNNTFYDYIETAYNNNIISGYSDGTFRPYNDVTRGQICKIVVLSAGWPVQTPTTPTFSDVPTTNPFYAHIETAYCHGVISGYSDSTFRPGNYAIRGQIAKIVYEALVGGHACSLSGVQIK